VQGEAIASLRVTLSKMNSTALLNNMSAVMDTFRELLHSPHVEIRKASTDMFVLIHAILGDAVLPHLASLPLEKKKLITIYIKKNKEKKQHGIAVSNEK
jgi:hypothetical protein